MAKSVLALRDEVDGVWYLEAYLKGANLFKLAGVFTYFEKLTSFHQQVEESFATVYFGRSTKIGKE